MTNGALKTVRSLLPFALAILALAGAVPAQAINLSVAPVVLTGALSDCGSFTGNQADSLTCGGDLLLAQYSAGTGTLIGSLTGATARTESGEIAYQYYLSGRGIATVDLLFNTQAFTSASGDAAATAFVALYFGNEVYKFSTCAGAVAQGCASASASGSFDVSQPFSAPLGTFFSVVMQGGAQTAGGSAAFSVDPTITFANPADAALYTLQASVDALAPLAPAPEIPAVPLPASAMLLLSGLAGMVLLMRRRRHD